MWNFGIWDEALRIAQVGCAGGKWTAGWSSGRMLRGVEDACSAGEVVLHPIWEFLRGLGRWDAMILSEARGIRCYDHAYAWDHTSLDIKLKVWVVSMNSWRLLKSHVEIWTPNPLFGGAVTPTHTSVVEAGGYTFWTSALEHEKVTSIQISGKMRRSSYESFGPFRIGSYVPQEGVSSILVKCVKSRPRLSSKYHKFLL